MFYATRVTGHLVTIGMAALLILSLSFLRTRVLTALVVIPFLVLYGLFFSHSVRAGLMIFPLLGLVSGQTIFELFASLDKLPVRTWRVRYQFWIGISAVGLLALFLMYRYGHESTPNPAYRVLIDPFLANTVDQLAPPALYVSIAALVLSLLPRVGDLRIPAGALVLACIAAFVI